MALTASFNSTESLSSPNLVTFNDTSTGTDLTITNRTITILLANGNYLTESGESSTPVSINWSYLNASITVNILSSSTTATVTVVWLDGNTPVYTVPQIQEWDLFDYLFAFGLLQSQSATPTIISDTNYYSNFFAFITNIWNSENAVTVGSDVYSSQSSLDVNLNMINNATKYF